MIRPAYYNEIDGFCCGALKRNIERGWLPPGDIDTRDIREVQPEDLRGYGQVHLFAGIGGFGLAARLAGWPDERPLWTGGYPCQPFSVAGLQAGISDDRYLWPEVARLLEGASERPPWCLFENVDGHTALGLDRTLFDLETLEYAGRPFWIPACAVKAPHERMRVWIVARDLADAERAERRTGEPGGDDAHWHDAGRPQETGGARECGENHIRGTVANSASELPHGGGCPGSRGRQEHSDRIDRTMGNGVGAGLQIREGITRHHGPEFPPAERTSGGAVDHGNRGRRGGGSEEEIRARRDGPEHTGPWDDHAWIVGSDGKARRVKPGIRLLAHGIPQRVAKLKSLGNAIVAEEAARVIRTMMEAP